MNATSLRAGATVAWRRIVVAVAVVAAAVVVSGCAAHHYQQASCRHTHNSIPLLEAQAVPSATLVPCILPLPGGWSYGGAQVRSGLARFWLNSDRAGADAAEVRLTRTCDLAGATPLPPARGGAPVRRYQAPAARQPLATVRCYLFTGGCVAYRFTFTRQTAPMLFDQADHFLGFTPRSVYVNGIRGMEGLTLCGAQAPPCPG
jgi:hypothetical protein